MKTAKQNCLYKTNLLYWATQKRVFLCKKTHCRLQCYITLQYSAGRTSCEEDKTLNPVVTMASAEQLLSNSEIAALELFSLTVNSALVWLVSGKWHSVLQLHCKNWAVTYGYSTGPRRAMTIPPEKLQKWSSFMSLPELCRLAVLP